MGGKGLLSEGYDSVDLHWGEYSIRVRLEHGVAERQIPLWFAKTAQGLGHYGFP